MKHTQSFTMSPLQCRVLSMLAAVGGPDGMSCTYLAQFTGIHRAVLYVLVARLRARRWVRRSRVRVPGRNEMQVLYAITQAGLKARRCYADEVGLTTTSKAA